MIENLRHRQELADRGCALDRERREIAAQGLRLVDRLAHLLERGAAGEIEAVFGIDATADGVVKLRAVHAEMNPAHAEPIGAHRGGKGK